MHIPELEQANLELGSFGLKREVNDNVMDNSWVMSWKQYACLNTKWHWKKMWVVQSISCFTDP